MSDLTTLPCLIAIRSQTAVAVIDLLQCLAARLDDTPWSWPGRTGPVRTSDIAVDVRVVTHRRPKEPLFSGFDPAQQERALRQVAPEDSGAARYELPDATDVRKTVRWRQLLREPHRRLVLKGGPGSGKSFITRHTAVWRLRQALAGLEQRRVRVAEAPATIWTHATALAESVSDNAPDALLSSLARSTGQPLSAPARRWLATAVMNPRALIIIDGLDEVEAQQLPQLRSHLARLLVLPSRVILTCRTFQWEEQRSEFLQFDIPEVELAPLTLREIRQFVQQAFKSSPERAARLALRVQTKAGLRHACTTPLRLLFVCLLEQEGILADDTTYAALYTHLLRLLMEGRWRQVRPIWVTSRIEVASAIRCLVAAGWEIFRRAPAANRFTLSDWEWAVSRAKIPERWYSDRLQDLVTLGVFVPAGFDRQGDACWSFVHRTLLEFCAARTLADQPQEVWLSEATQHFWFAPEWLEVLTLLASAVEDATPLVAAVEGEEDDVFGSMLALRTRLVGAAVHVDTACEQRTIDALVQLLENLDVPPSPIILDRSRAIVLLLGAKIVSQLIVLLRDRLGYEKRQQAAVALGDVGDPRGVEPLIGALREDPDGNVRRSAALALATLGDLRAIESLAVAVVHDPEPQVRFSVAQAMGALGDPRAFEPLVAALTNDPSDDVRRSAADALGELGDPRALEPLLATFHDDATSWWVRDSAGWALLNLSDGAAFEPLVSVLRDPLAQQNMQAEAVRLLGALGAMGERRAFEPLVAVLRDHPDRLVRYAAAEALGTLGDVRAVDPLLGVLPSLTGHIDDYDGFRSVARALGVLGDSRAAEPLIAVLREGMPSWLVKPVADALAALDDPRAVELLLRELREDRFSRCDTANYLGALGDRRAIEPLAAVVREHKYEVKSAAAIALGRLGDVRAVEGLLYTLHDDNDGYGSREAYYLLGALGDSRAVEPLIAILQESPDERANRAVRSEDTDGTMAAKALCMLGDARAFDTLARYLHTAPSVDPALSMAMMRFSAHCRRPLRWSERGTLDS